MSQNDEWSPDEPLGTEAFEQGDEALDDDSGTDVDLIEAVEIDPSLDPALQADEREREEAGPELDDPEKLGTLDGGIDDPDGIDGSAGPTRSTTDEAEGWDLDAPLARDGGPDGDATD
jgi:hypothetical protein